MYQQYINFSFLQRLWTHICLHGSVKCLKVNTQVEIQLDNAKNCSAWRSHPLLLWPLSKARGPQIWSVLPLLASILGRAVYSLTTAPIPPLRVYLLFSGCDEPLYCSAQIQQLLSEGCFHSVGKVATLIPLFGVACTGMTCFPPQSVVISLVAFLSRDIIFQRFLQPQGAPQLCGDSGGDYGGKFPPVCDVQTQCFLGPCM